MNEYLKYLGIEIDLNEDIQSLVRITTPQEALSFFVVNRAFMDITSPNIDKIWVRDARRFIASDDCEAYARDFSPNPKSFVKKLRRLINKTVSPAGSKIMNLT